jgi:hypothetical protein
MALTTHSICAMSDVIDHTVDSIGTHDRLAGINAHFAATIARKTRLTREDDRHHAAARFTHR